MKTLALLVLTVVSYAVFTESQTTTRSPTTLKAATTKTFKPTTVKTLISTTTPKTTTKTITKTSPTTTAKTTTKTTTKPTTTAATKSSTTTRTTTTTKPAIKSFVVCRDANSSAPNGILYPAFTANTTKQTCRFDIIAPPDYQIQFVCPFKNITLYRSFLTINGIVRSQAYNSESVVANRTYYSNGTSLYLNVVFSKSETFSCQWTTTPKRNTTDYKICQQLSTTAPNGTIRSAPSEGGPARPCSFSIQSPNTNQQIQISCSVVNLASIASSFLFLYGVNDDHYTLLYGQTNPPVLNRFYYSSSSGVSVESSLGLVDEFVCNWTTTPRIVTTDFKMCRYGATASPNGTITPLTAGMTNGEPTRNCSFSIGRAPAGQQIQISCSVVNLNSSNSEFYIVGTVEDLWPNRPVQNRIYYSSNDVRVSSKYDPSDSFNCKWTTVPNLVTTNFKLCRDEQASGVTSGTLQSMPEIAMGEPPRNCHFYVLAPLQKMFAISCSVVDLVSNDGQVEIGQYGNPLANPPVVNQVYTLPANITDSTIYVITRLGYGDSLSCQWTFN